MSDMTSNKETQKNCASMHSYNPKSLAAYNNTGGIPIKYVFVMTSTQRFRISLLVRAMSINFIIQYKKKLINIICKKITPNA